MKPVLIILFLFVSSLTLAQDKAVEEVLAEGKLMYRLEKGSWYGTDHMLAQFDSKVDSVGGYISYETDDNLINTIFFDRYDNDRILLKYQFDSVPGPNPRSIDTTNQTANDYEKNLIAIRQDARDRAYTNNEDNFFSFYENTALNFIPIITETEKKVLVITGPQVSDVVLIGNDYELTYDDQNNFLKKVKIHNSLLQLPYKSEDSENPAISTVHTHIVDEIISSTDICTLLLYRDYVEWNQHTVVGKEYISIFELDTASLTVMTVEAFKNILGSKD